MTKLKDLRRQRGLSQRTIASKLKVSRTIVQSWERGDKKPRLERFANLAHLLGVTQERLAEALGISPQETTAEVQP